MLLSQRCAEVLEIFRAVAGSCAGTGLHPFHFYSLGRRVRELLWERASVPVLSLCGREAC